ncbi:F-box domain protein [Xylaria bambusicola]|uniref:F-box domain protein n=1 Tax=Xylaria bambusicola TaxID=326684 RepID=UPI0020085A97|nr:F-box domain protein [Xylaria bambusicola]KAI0521718.1 F-box domain protein [Xylaria bambusicola]
MALTFIGLPSELLDKIIEHSMPEGFESLAVTCKLIYAHCIRFIPHHNHLRLSFRVFEYSIDEPPCPPRENHNYFAFELLNRIAAEPRVARYIIEASFCDDSVPDFYPTSFSPVIDDGSPLVALFANSSYLARAGLDWKEYYALVKQEVQRPGYSQHAAAFVLTLLPNVTSLVLPQQWKPSDKTDRLLEVIVREARQPKSIWNEPSLAKLTGFEPNLGDLNEVVPFLALPHVRRFFSVLGSNCSMTLASKNQYIGWGEMLESVSFKFADLELKYVSEFFTNTPRLKELHLFFTGSLPETEDFCGLVAVIESKVGNQLEELYFYGLERDGFKPGQASLHGFQRLLTLRCPLKLAISRTNKALPRPLKDTDSLKGSESEVIEPSISDLIPDSVTTLSLLTDNEEHYRMALDILFSDVVVKEGSKLPFLKKISIYFRWDGSVDVEEAKRLEAKALEAGVLLHLHHFNPSGLPYNIEYGNF